MPFNLLLLLLLLSPALAYLLYRFAKRSLDVRLQKQRVAAMTEPFPPQWRQLLHERFALYRRLPTDLQRKLEAHIQVFLHEKVFVGCDGFVITDSVRVLIAAQACLLILNNGNGYYPGFESILVYPHTYQALESHRDGWLQTDYLDTRAGESWHRGPLVLAWNEVMQGAFDGADGYNVVLHEFAHKLDDENPSAPGLPVLAKASQYSDWARVLSREYEQLRHRRDTVINDYGATSAAEFFAVITEAFFEKPLTLQQRHPELYQQLQLYYQLDPAAWVD